MLLSSCSTVNFNTNETRGTIGGATVGGVLGAVIGNGKVLPVVVGILVGGIIGREIGKYLDERDRIEFGSMLESLNDGETKKWHNYKNGRSYELTPTKTNVIDDCVRYRDFRLKVYLEDGKTDLARATAVRDCSGIWKIIKSSDEGKHIY